ncbi:MAG TPA: ThiF family adenylyltransferase [Candidatus Limnocylindrales bacterium]|nr:ThiF family adenylyltransferase [Candidatus Limnocylindrales bacterium]
MAVIADKPWWERYSRQILFPPIGREGQEKLLQSRVAVIGMGALGTVSANCLARAGVGFLRLVDRDFVEPSNLQRQILFTEDDANKVMPKATAALEKLAAVNSNITYEAIIDDVNHTNILDIISDVDLVLDATDNFEIRFLINEASVKCNKPWIYGACVASYGITFSIIPGETACLHCFFGDLPAHAAAETCDTAGVLAPIVNVIASLQAMEALKYLSGNSASLNQQVLFIDLWQNEWTKMTVSRSEDCAVCVNKKYQYLSGEMEQQSTYLCGREAFQVLPSRRVNLSLGKLTDRLSALGRVTGNEYLIKFNVDQYEIIIFPDGRAIIKGTADPKIARSLYARYVGG